MGFKPPKVKHIDGQNFSISARGEVYDFLKKMAFLSDEREVIDQVMEEKQADQAFFRSVAIEASIALKRFQKLDMKRYMAHCKQYVIPLMKAIGEKDTIDGRAETILRHFGKENNDKEKSAKLSFAGSLILSKQASTKMSISEIMLSPKFVEGWKEYMDEMYSYEETYDDVINHELDLEQTAADLDAIARAFDDRGTAISQVYKDKTIEKERFQDSVIRDITERVTARVEHNRVKRINS